MTHSQDSSSTSPMIPLVLFAAFMIMQANFLILPSLAIFIAEDFSLTNQDLSFLLAAFSVAVALSNFVWSRYLDKINRKTVLLTGGFLVAVVFAITSIASNFNMLVASRVLMAVVMPLMGASILPFVADIYAPKDRPRIMGWVMSAGYVVSLALIPLVVLVSDHLSWRHVGFGMAVFTGLVFVVAAVNLPRPETSPAKAAGAKAKFDLFGPEHRPMVTNLLKKFLQTAGIFTMFAVYPTWLNSGADGVSYSSSTMAAIFFVSGVLGFFGSTVSGRMNEVFQKASKKVEPLLMSSLICAALCFLVPILGKGSPMSQYISYAPMIFFQSIAVVLLMNGLITSVDPSKRGFVNAMSNIVFQAGIAVGSFVGFWMFEQLSITAVFVCAGLLIAASALNFLPQLDPNSKLTLDD